jgi:hypothetical protein
LYAQHRDSWEDDGWKVLADCCMRDDPVWHRGVRFKLMRPLTFKTLRGDLGIKYFKHSRLKIK